MSATLPARAPFAAERDRHVLRVLAASGRVEAAEVAAALGVTGETVRKDLIRLEARGLLQRVHGGAVPVEGRTVEPAVVERTALAAEKRRIAVAALAHLPDRGAVLLDSGSTVALVAQLFPTDRELDVYTTALPTAMGLLARPNLTVHLLGGRVRRATGATVGPIADRALHDLNVDVALLGTNAISVQRGLTTPDPAEAETKSLMLAAARRRVLLADHSKVGLVSRCRYADLDDVDLLVSDTGLADDRVAELSAAGLPVERA